MGPKQGPGRFIAGDIMQTIEFELNGRHSLTLPDGGMYRDCAEEIVTGKAYPFPTKERPKSVVDIGAHVGEWTVCAAALWPMASIAAFEPFPSSYRLLVDNCQGFPNITPFQLAVNREGGPAEFRLSSCNAMCHSLLRRDTDSGETLEVQCAPVSFVEELKPDILKIDAEGVEADILEGLDTKRIYRIYVEFHYENDRRRICKILDSTHSLAYGRIQVPYQGELMFVRRD